MTVCYEYIETKIRGYRGFEMEAAECRTHFCGRVKDSLLDQEERLSLLETLDNLMVDTGFINSAQLLDDIQTLAEQDVDFDEFRIGEAFSEVILEEHFDCRFHWNELRDARNPKGNKTGADLVGFIEVEEQVLFLFGEVKTSSETNRRPPQVMTKSDGIENQLRDLYNDRKKRLILIGYLKNKARLHAENHPFRVDFDRAILNYYSDDDRYHLTGVLIRDVASDKRDLSGSYTRLRTDILESSGLHLLALYVPISKDEWLKIVNSTEE